MNLPPAIGGIERLVKRYENAVSKRENFRSLLTDCYTYAIPDRELFNQQGPGQPKGNELFDSTAIVAVQDFASRLQATICPSWRTWSKLAPGPGLPKELRESDELALLLEDQTDNLFGYINHSNFALKSHESFQDVSCGTGALTLDLNEDRTGLVFESIPAPYLAIEEGPTGLVETVFMDRKSPVNNLDRLYPGIVLPQKWQDKMRTNPTDDVEFVVGCVFDPTRKEYWLIVFSKVEKASMYVRSYGESSPCIVFRWSNIPGETWGRGPVMSALPDIKTLNKVVEFMLRGAALTISPPYTAVTDGVLNPYTAQIAPDTIIPVMSNDTSNPSLKPLLTNANPDFGQFILADMRQTVRNQMFSDPRRKEGPIESATEVMIEDRDFVQRIGSAFGRLQTEFIERVINRAVYLLRSIGKMPDFRVDGREVTLKHQSPLARAQDMEELMALQQATELAAPFGPEALQIGVKTEDIVEYIFKKAGVDARVLRSDVERKEMLEKGAQLAAQQLQAQQQQQPATR